MKLISALLFLLFISGNSSFAQENRNDLQVINSISDYSCEDLLSQLDGLTINGLQNPNSKVYVVIYGADDSIRNKFLERYLDRYRQIRKIDKSRFVILPTRTESKFRVELIISKSGTSKPNVKEEPFPFVLTKSAKPVIFVRETVEVVKSEGKWNYYGECPACCIEGYYSDFLAEYLKANPNFYARIKIYGKNKAIKKKLSGLIREQLLTEYKVSTDRFLISIKGIDQGIVQLSRNLATVEIDFVPQK